ncbi:MAG: acetate kinase [Sulfuricellaceae bacterium]|nr:acetate kinase [Sulfuricellaceae bacterium]
MKNLPILTLNSGSSSLKASLFRTDGSRRDFRYEHIGHGFPHDHGEAFDRLMQDLAGDRPAAVGHRFVHGGDIVAAARRLDRGEIARLRAITHLAPLHMPGNLLGAELCAARFDVPQIACFDTAFHASLPEYARRLPIPQELGLRRYGFHGLNYAHVARELPAILGSAAKGRVAVAHLGSGASLCLLENLQSVDTTMGYTPAGGIPMGTRSGDLDPGVMLELAKRYTQDELADLVFHRMGLLALSGGESNEMAELLASGSAAARFAVEYFCRQVRGAIGAFAAKAGGLDALVFTAGIGEHAPLIRSLICDPLDFLGFALDDAANQTNRLHLGRAGSKPVLTIDADEESEIRLLVEDCLAASV